MEAEDFRCPWTWRVLKKPACPAKQIGDGRKYLKEGHGGMNVVVVNDVRWK